MNTLATTEGILAPENRMTPERREKLEADTNLVLTHAEELEGYHWCSEWDLLLVGPGDAEASCCRCHSNNPVIEAALRRNQEDARKADARCASCYDEGCPDCMDDSRLFEEA